MMMKNPAPSAPVMNHLRPLIRQPPSAPDRAGGQRRRVRARPGCGFGHGERRADVAAGERREELLLLLRVGDVREHVHVALVGRRDVQRRRAEQRVARRLEHRRAVDMSRPWPPYSTGACGAKTPGVAGGLLQVDAQLRRRRPR